MDKLLQQSSGVTFHRNHIQKSSNAYFLEQDNTYKLLPPHISQPRLRVSLCITIANSLTMFKRLFSLLVHH